MRIIVILFLCLNVLNSNAQFILVKDKPSGYFGKRLALGVSLTCGISNDLQRPTTEMPEKGQLTINRDFSASLYFSAKSTLNLGVLVGNSNTSCFLDLYADRYHPGSPVYDVNGKKYGFQSLNGSPSIRDLTIGIDFKIFSESKGGIAPIGQYFNIGLIGHQYTIDLSPLSYNVWSWETNKSITLSDKSLPAVKVLPEIFTGVGISQPVFKVLLIDLGIKLGFLMILKYDTIIDNNGVQSSLEKNIYNRLRSREYLNVNIGLSVPF